MKIKFAPEVIIKFLIIIIIILFGANCISLIFTHIFHHQNVYGLVPLFHFDREANFPAYFSALMLLFAAILFLVIGFHHSREKIANAKYWKILGFIFLYISIDEAVALHELLIDRPRAFFNLSGIFYFAWVIPFGFLLLVFGFFFFRFWLQLNKKTRFYLALAGIIYVGGAFGIELIGAYYYDYIDEKTDLLYDFITTVEELCEMTGITILLYILMDYIRQNIQSITLKFEKQETPA